MTIIVAYAPRAEGRAALDKGIEIAKRRNEHLMVVNAISGGNQDDPSFADTGDAEAVEKQLARAGISAEFKQFVRGKSAVSEIVELAESTDVSLVIVGLRGRQADPGQRLARHPALGPVPGPCGQGESVSDDLPRAAVLAAVRR